VLPTNLDGTAVSGGGQSQQTGQPAPSPIVVDKEMAAAAAAAAAASTGGSDADPLVSEQPPFAWENLHFSVHLFVGLLCRYTPFEGGSIDQLILALLKHVAELDDLVEQQQQQQQQQLLQQQQQQQQNALSGSRRGSKQLLGGEDGLSSPLSMPARTNTGDGSLASDFRQLFHKARKGSKASLHVVSARHPKRAQIAIVQLLHAILTQASAAWVDASESEDDDDDANAAANARAAAGSVFNADEDDEYDAAHSAPAPLCLMNYQIILDQLLSLLLRAVRSSGAVAASSASAAGASASATDAEVLEAERSAESAANLAQTYLRLLSNVTPSLVVQ
jgi:hypothetical protein